MGGSVSARVLPMHPAADGHMVDAPASRVRLASMANTDALRRLDLYDFRQRVSTLYRGRSAALQQRRFDRQVPVASETRALRARSDGKWDDFPHLAADARVERPVDDS